MAAALARAFLAAGLYPAGALRVADPDARRRALFAELGVTPCTDGAAAARGAGTVLVCVKPGVVAEALRAALPGISASALVISIAAGVSLASLEALVPGRPVVRVMPNAAVQVGAGASALCGGTHAGAEHLAHAERLLGAGGRCVRVAEEQMDAVTGLSGSGPAYACLLIEALADGGVRAGLPREVAVCLAAQTLLGGAALVLETGEHPAVWKDRVATPGGTTIAGLEALERAGVRGALMAAVREAAARSRELGAQDISRELNREPR